MFSPMTTNLKLQSASARRKASEPNIDEQINKFTSKM